MRTKDVIESFLPSTLTVGAAADVGVRPLPRDDNNTDLSIIYMKTNRMTCLLLAAAFLCGCERTTPISGVWHSKVGDQDTLHFHDNGLWQRDTVVWAKGKSYPMIYGGHYSIIDTNHVKVVVEVSNGTDTFTNEFYLVGGKLCLGELEPPHIKMMQYDYISK